MKEPYEEKTKPTSLSRGKESPGGFGIGTFWELLIIRDPGRLKMGLRD
jgi:hypothetical protein